jgi:hypothetical protein
MPCQSFVRAIGERQWSGIFLFVLPFPQVRGESAGWGQLIFFLLPLFYKRYRKTRALSFFDVIVLVLRKFFGQRATWCHLRRMLVAAGCPSGRHLRYFFCLLGTIPPTGTPSCLGHIIISTVLSVRYSSDRKNWITLSCRVMPRSQAEPIYLPSRMQ